MMRATFFYKDSNGFGWTETFHNNLATYAGVIAQVQRLMPLRLALLGSNASLVYVRVSDDDVTRDSQVISIAESVGVGTWRGVSALADVCLLVRCTPNPATTAQVRKILSMRGIPKAVLGAGDVYTPISAWNVAFRNWADEIANGAWCIKATDRLIVPQVITNVAQVVATGVTTINTAGNHGLLPGGGVRISGVSGASQVNGVWNVLGTPSLTSFTIQVPLIVGAYVGGGTARGIGYRLWVIFNVKDERVSERKAGRPFDSPHGRRKRRRART
jgi:hypothetical protein